MKEINKLIEKINNVALLHTALKNEMISDAEVIIELEKKLQIKKNQLDIYETEYVDLIEILMNSQNGKTNK